MIYDPSANGKNPHVPIFSPREGPLLKTLLIEPETVVTPLQDLYPVAAAAAVAEDEHCRLIRIADMLKVHNSGQAVCSLAHIRRAADKINLFAPVIKHKISPSR